MRRFLLALLLLIAAPAPARAAVTMTFWSHDFGKSFPHAFIMLRGAPDAGGAAIDATYGFTARRLSISILFGTVPGAVEPSAPAYVAASEAQFAVVLTDPQYAEIRALVAAWSERTGDSRYSLNNRNCVHFVREAARIAGLAGLDQPRLMKKPRSYLQAVEAANRGRVTAINLTGAAYLATLPPAPGG